MSLGVLNNLSAMYAENNLNNTSNSLTNVLHQLSSGSKINSGADDAAGLSLVDGLQANSAALAQSQTNAQEGVGLLQVADGALSQVTSLLNRAVTLATEASNGTLNSSQDTAANNEYQSILSEINNIGATTTYNGTAVFGNASTNIYTGDSSTVGASIDALNISSLSSSNVGDTGGVMAYSNGNNNVFLNLSSGSANGANAQATDTLNASGTTTINVNYLVSGANGTKTSASTSISVGGSTGYTNTANGLISAINGAGIGLTASFTTQAQAGVSGGGTQTGIQITGGLLSVGVAPSTVSTGGILNLSGSSANSLLSPNQNVSIQSGSAAAISINVTPSIKTLSDLASAINMQSAANAGNSALTQVVATVVTNADNSQSLSLVDSNPSGGQLSVNDTAYTYTPQLTANTAVTGAAVNLSFTATQTGNAAIAGSPATSAVATLGIGGITNSASDALTGSIVLSNGASGNITINMGAGSDSNSGSTINLSTANSNLTGLMNALNVTTGGSASAALGVTAAVSSSGLTMTSIAGNTTIATTSGALSSAPTVSLQSSQNGAAAFAGTVGTTVISMINGTGLNGGDTLAAGSSITVTNSSLNSPGTPITFMVGASTGAANTFYTGGGNMTLSNLVGIMNSGAGAAAAGLSGAVLSGANGNITLTSATVGTTISTTSTVAEQVSTNGTTYTAAIAQNLVGSSSSGASLGTSVGLDANLDPIGLNGDKLAGSLVLTNGSSAVTVTFGAASDTNSGTAIGLTAANSTLTGLMNALNVMTSGSASLALGMTATMNATNTGLDFATTKTGTTMNVNTAGMTNVSTMEFTNPTTAGVGINASGTIALSDSGKITGNPATTAGAGTITGQVMITSGSVVDTFVMGSNAANTINGNTNTINVNGNSLNDLIAAIANESTGGKLGGASLGVSAVQDTATGGIFLQSTVANTPLSVDTSGLTDVMAEAKNNGTVGAPIVPTAIPAQVIFGTGTTNSATDVVAGQIVIQNSGGINPGGTTTFIMGGSAYNSGNPAATGLGTNAVTVNGNTLADLARAINADSTGAYAGTAGVNLIAAASDNKGLTVKAATQSDVLSNYTSTLQDQYALANGVVGSQGQAATAATYATASLGTGQKIGSSAELSGNIVLNNGGVNYTFTMANSSAGSTSTAINTSAKTLAALQAAITQSNIGINASIDGNGVLQLQSTNPATSITVASSALVDTQGEAFTGGSGSAGSPATAPHASMATVTLAGNSTAALAADMLNGSITLTGTGGTETFTMGGLTSGSLNNGGTLGVEVLPIPSLRTSMPWRRQSRAIQRWGSLPRSRLRDCR